MSPSTHADNVFMLTLLRLLIGGLMAFGFAKLLNARAFKAKLASRPVAFGLSCLVLILSLIILSFLKTLMHRELSSSPLNPLDVPGAFICAWVFYLSVKREQKNKQANNDKVVEGLFKEEKSESQQPVLEERKPIGVSRYSNCPTDFDIDEADLDNETKNCSACKKTIKLLAKKCRFCGVLFEQKEIEKAIKSRNIEIIERNLEISLDDEFKRCPACAESINVKSMECEFCGEVFDPSEVEIRAKYLISEKLYLRTAEIETVKTGSEPPIEKDIILDNVTRTIQIVFIFIAGLVILIVAIGISVDSPNKSSSPTNDREYGVTGGKDSGIAFMEKGDYQQAINGFNKFIELEPLDHDAYNNRGEAYFKLGNYLQAREDFNRAIIAINHGSESNPEGLVGAAKINKQFNIWFPEHSLEAKYYRNRGLAYEKLGNKNQATKDLKTAAMVGDKEAQNYLLSKEMTW